MNRGEVETRYNNMEGVQKMNCSIKPGQVWLDDDGKRIHAHGGKVFYENGIFYWYGENKEKTDGKNGIWTYGIRCYSSRDLYNWKDEGLIIPPNLEDMNSPLHPNKHIDRPHIIYNEKTKKYVCWIKINGESSFFILTADQLLGPYTLVRENVRPLGGKVGDFELVKDEKTKKAYLYFDHNRKEIVAVELSEDFLDVTDCYTINYEGLTPPFTREGVAHIQHEGLHYLITSCRTGYAPNPSEYAVADDWLGPFIPKGNPHENDESSASFNSQISGVFKHPKKRNLYIVTADRWLPKYEVTKEKFDIISRAVASRYDSRYSVTEEEEAIFKQSPCGKDNEANTSISDYVWLPAFWEDEKLVIRWYNEWKIEDFD